MGFGRLELKFQGLKLNLKDVLQPEKLLQMVFSVVKANCLRLLQITKSVRNLMPFSDTVY